jgi:hypothetical protein
LICPHCSQRFTAAGRPKTYCSRACQKAGSNAARQTTREGRQAAAPALRIAASTPELVTAPLSASTAFQADPACAYAPGDRVLMFVDHPAIGCGERPFVVLDIVATSVRLYSAAQLVDVNVSRRDFDTYARAYGSAAESALAILRRNLTNGTNPTVDRDLAEAVAQLVADRPAPADVEWRIAA